MLRRCLGSQTCAAAPWLLLRLEASAKSGALHHIWSIDGVPIVGDVFRRLAGASTLCTERRTLLRDIASLGITPESAILSGQRYLVRSHPTW